MLLTKYQVFADACYYYHNTLTRQYNPNIGKVCDSVGSCYLCNYPIPNLWGYKRFFYVYED